MDYTTKVVCQVFKISLLTNSLDIIIIRSIERWKKIQLVFGFVNLDPSLYGAKIEEGDRNYFFNLHAKAHGKANISGSLLIYQSRTMIFT